MELLEGLRNNYLLNGLTEYELGKVAAIAVEKAHPASTVIVQQFDRSSDVMVVLEGSICVNSFSGERIVEGGPGSIIGEISLVDHKPRSATVVSTTAVRLGVIPAGELWEIMQSDADLARKVLYNIAQVLCIRLRSANLHMDTLRGRISNPSGD